MPVRCPACHSDQTKPTPTRNLWERLTDMLGRKAYFCEDCYRRFTPSKSNASTTEKTQPPFPETHKAPQVAMVVEVPAVTAEPSPAREEHQTSAPPPLEEEDSLISRMRREQMKEQDYQDEAAAPEKASRLALLPLSPAKLAGALGGAVLLIVVILWYHSYLNQPLPVAQIPATRVKISESTAPSRSEGLPNPATSSAPASAVVLSPPAPSTREAAPLSTEPAGAAPLPTPAAPQAQASVPVRRNVSPAPTRKVPVAKAKPSVAKPSVSKAQDNYAVQFGAFGQAPRAQALAANLKVKGIQVQVVAVKGRDGKIWHKVRSGQLATREAAQRAQRKLEQSSGVKGMVVRMKP
ncbi:SPOR domain-containing protein [Desulfarculales bacterium]